MHNKRSKTNLSSYPFDLVNSVLIAQKLRHWLCFPRFLSPYFRFDLALDRGALSHADVTVTANRVQRVSSI